jgi:hypothetical protein
MPGEARRRRLYVASRKADAFGFLASYFSFTERPEEAEFIICDLGHPVEDLSWLQGRGLFYTRECPVPLLAVDFEETGREATERESFLKTVERVRGHRPEIYTKPDNLEKVLRWLEQTLPFYNARLDARNEEGQKLYTALLLQAMREPAPLQ